MEPEDIQVLYRWENDPSGWLVSGTVAPFSRQVIKKYLDASHQDIYTNKELRLIIELIEEGLPIGCIDLFDFDPGHHRAGVGIIIGEQEKRSSGYANEALSLLIEYAFGVLGLHQLFANIAVDNFPSLKLFENCGFHISGTKKEWILSGGKRVDEHFLQLISNGDVK